MADEAGLEELLETITGRVKDSIRDLEEAVKCIETYRGDKDKIEACILQYLSTGESSEKIV
ncbi:MAG: hypothetical protein DRO07_02790 [Candidatus Iainarchaeum archaeon]|uniref:Uncharacterized protein n=1 Tax=Candidatus Iainarchaeum sp. TaxID=3101447 RepID=A0A497JF92_9ARCH|nr:MAG: hypothetical protein DRO07_02790 [Candidatus Diapherotrites archaeon]